MHVIHLCFAYGIMHERDQLGTSAIARGDIRSAWLNTSSDTLYYFLKHLVLGASQPLISLPG